MEHIVTSIYVAVLLLVVGVFAEPLKDQFSKSSEERLSRVQELREQIPQKSGRYFHGGTGTAEWASYPFTVAILKGKEIIYGGAIIGEQFILTTEDLLAEDDPKELRVRAGQVEKQVAEIFAREGHDETYHAAYTAVIKLEDKFDLTGPNISAIKLREFPLPVGSICTLMGIANISEATPPDQVLHYVNVPTVDNSLCVKNWGEEWNINEAHLCSGAYGEDLHDCYPSPGDPLVCDGVLSGTASLLNLCGTNEYPGLYGNVAYDKDWIEEQMKK